MRKTWLILILNLCIAAAFAQNSDSITRQKVKGVKVAVINGSVMRANKNIIQNVSGSQDYTMLLNAIKAAGLTETFESKGPITIFAPTNNAFTKLPAGTLDTLLKPKNKYELSTLVTYHAIPGKVSIKDIAHSIKEHKGTATFITLAGSKIAATFDANRNIVLTDETGGQCVVSQVDIEQSNGMLHVINSLIIPKHSII